MRLFGKRSIKITEKDLKAIQGLLPTQGRVKGAVLLCIDNQLPFEVLKNDQRFVDFITQNKKDIETELGRHKIETERNKEHETIEGNNYIDYIFQLLEQNEAITGKTDYANIKLHDAGGGIEFINHFSFADIQYFIKQLNIETDPSRLIDGIKLYLQEHNLYEPSEKFYSVGLTLSSKRKLLLLLDPNTEIDTNALQFELTGNKDKIIDIVSGRGYEREQKNSIDIIGGKNTKGSDDEDYRLI